MCTNILFMCDVTNFCSWAQVMTGSRFSIFVYCVQNVFHHSKKRSSWNFFFKYLFPISKICIQDCYQNKGEERFKKIFSIDKKDHHAKKFLCSGPIYTRWNQPTNIKQKVWKVSPTKGVLEELEIKAELDPEPNWFKRAKQWLPL